MNIQQLDQEFKNLSELTTQVTAHIEANAKEKFGRAQHEYQVYLQLENALMARIRYIERMAERGPFLPKGDGALVLWVQRLSDRLRVFYHTHSASSSKLTWIKILQQRSGSTPHPRASYSVMQEEQLIYVLEKRQQLEESRDYWHQRLAALKEQVKVLTHQHLALTITQENLKAGHSMQMRLGRNLEDALSGPILSSLKSMLRGWFLPISFPKQFALMRAALSSFQREANRFLQASRAGALASMDPTGLQRELTLPKGKGPQTATAMESSRIAMQHNVRKKQEDYLQRQKDLTEKPFPNLHPKLMQS